MNDERRRGPLAALVAFGLLAMTVSEIVEGEELAECATTPTTVNVVMYESRGALSAAYRKITGERPFNLSGFATMNTRTGVKTLHVRVIKDRRDTARLATLGHELMHALCGDWHPDTPE